MLQNANQSILDELDQWVSDYNVTDLEGVSPEYFLKQSGVETELSSLPPAEPIYIRPIPVSPAQSPSPQSFTLYRLTIPIKFPP